MSKRRKYAVVRLGANRPFEVARFLLPADARAFAEKLAKKWANQACFTRVTLKPHEGRTEVIGS
jgi:hypothetical protein